MWVRVPPPEFFLDVRATVGELLDQLSAAGGAVVLFAPGGKLTGALGEGAVAEEAASGPAQRRRAAEAPGEREPGLRPGTPHRGLAHVTDQRADQQRRAGAERPRDGAVAAVGDHQ